LEAAARNRPMPIPRGGQMNAAHTVLNTKVTLAI
jgi:hypothetical protein